MKMTRLEKRLVNAPSHGRRVAEHALRRLERVPVRPGQSYLDVGCGNGAATLAIADLRRLAVTGVDVDPDQIREARNAAGVRKDIHFEPADATGLPFPDESFDIVATFKTLHHVPAWERAVSEMARVLKPEGWLIYSDLAAPHWLARLGRRWVGRHAGFVTRSALVCQLGAQGLDVLHEESHGFVIELLAHRPGGFRRCTIDGGRDRRRCALRDEPGFG